MLDNPEYYANMMALEGVYLDAGNQDELGMNAMADAFAYKMAMMGIPHTYENFDGGHFSALFSRLEISLKYCSDRMN